MKKIVLRAWLTCGLVAALSVAYAAVLPTSVQAQEESEAISTETPGETPWYQVDVLVFRQKSQNQEQEKLPPIAPHTRPLDSMTLYTGKQLTIPATLLPQPTPEPAAATPSIAGLIDDGATMAVPDDYLGQPTPAAAPVLEPENAQVETKTEHVTDRKPDLDTQAFVLLPPDMSQLEKAARSLRWSKDYRLLWKSSWRMPLVKDADPISISIAAGHQSGRSREIEGVLQLSLKRFLHAETDLWINELNPIRPLNHILAGAPFLTPQINKQSLISNRLPGPVELKQPQLRWPESTLNYSANMPLKASKRLASGKLIYIDNPQAGLLIKVTPWERPEEEAITEDFNGLDGANR